MIASTRCRSQFGKYRGVFSSLRAGRIKVKARSGPAKKSSVSSPDRPLSVTMAVPGAGRLAGWPVSICRACSRSPKSLGFARPNPVRRPRKATWRHPKADLRYRRLLARWRQPALVTERDIKRDRADSRTQIIGFCVPGGMIGDPRWDAPGHRRGGRARSGSCFGSVAGGMVGVCLGVFLDCRHGPQVFLVEAADDESAEGADDGGHGDVQDQPAAHPGAGVLRLE